MPFKDTLLPQLWLPAGHFRAVQPPVLPKVQLSGMQLPLQFLLQHPQTAGLPCPGLQVLALRTLPLLVQGLLAGQLMALWLAELPARQGLHQAALCLQLALLVTLRLLPIALPPLVLLF